MEKDLARKLESQSLLTMMMKARKLLEAQVLMKRKKKKKRRRRKNKSIIRNSKCKCHNECQNHTNKFKHHLKSLFL